MGILEGDRVGSGMGDFGGPSGISTDEIMGGVSGRRERQNGNHLDGGPPFGQDKPEGNSGARIEMIDAPLNPPAGRVARGAGGDA